MKESVCSRGRWQDKEVGAGNGSMFLKQLDNLFGLGTLQKRHGNDVQAGQGEERKGGGWRGKVVVGLSRGKAGGERVRRGEGSETGIAGSKALLP